MSHATFTTRRTVLATITAAGSGSVVGCTDTNRGTTSEGDISRVTVDGTELVVEYDSETSATDLAVIAPSGEAFAERSLTPGASRETITIGTAYPLVPIPSSSLRISPWWLLLSSHSGRTWSFAG
ncbi:hypothetical protein C463_15000 [Halorubrum californiense DSM 19288]|uniref:Uncharacterized protein n=1 Tax=Halorubrum californiense DSM 19288 TaxID=1227465 RepID=M0E226_9EURY|nr:hypothetical protein C463_15000 [Halorubrum californiense DSM 19288]